MELIKFMHESRTSSSWILPNSSITNFVTPASLINCWILCNNEMLWISCSLSISEYPILYIFLFSILCGSKQSIIKIKIFNRWRYESEPPKYFFRLIKNKNKSSSSASLIESFILISNFEKYGKTKFQIHSFLQANH